MQVNDPKPGEVGEIPENQDRAELRRAAHKIAWTRMNGSINAANPFVEAKTNRLTPADGE